MSAIPEENQLLAEKLEQTNQVSIAKRVFTVGSFIDHEVIIAFSRWGKVAAAMTATQLISRFRVDAIIFTGVAGSCSSNINIGDIVIATNLIQHDMDARPLFQKFEIPLIGLQDIETDRDLTKLAYNATKKFLKNNNLFLDSKKLDFFHMSSPKLHQGLVASGDKFFSSEKQITKLLEQLPKTLCVEMEGAAVAQVCHEHQLPCTIIRTISDAGNESAAFDFQEFVSSIASQYSLGIIYEILLNIGNKCSLNKDKAVAKVEHLNPH